MREKLYGVFRELTLKDGTAVFIREVKEEDREELFRLYSCLSDESLCFRFFSRPTEYGLREFVEKAVKVDFRNSVGIVAIYGNRIVGHAEYRALSKDRAEVAFAVSDDFQDRGVGTAMLGVLAEIAEKNGIEIFEANVRSDNHRMIKLFRDSGFPVKTHVKYGTIVVEMPTALTEEVLEQFERRDKIATVNALRRFFQPKSVAVIGASRDRKKVGGKTLYNMLVYGYTGTIYPVNSKARSVQGIKSYPSIGDIPDEIDLAVISVPAEEVIEVAEECGRKGVKALVILSAGFAEVGEEGKKRQEKLLEICRTYGMRLIGPNCMGILVTDPEIRLNATFAPKPPMEGRIGFASQSGAVGLAIMEFVNSHGLGLSYFVSLGNKADISSNDLIEYWEDDEKTDVIMLYLESFGNPRKFARLAKRVSRKKPILALASGITPAGAKAVASHTGSIISTSSFVVDSFFKQVGIIRASSLDELFGVAAFLLSQPLPGGKNVAIVTNGGGLGAITADWCEQVGLNIPELSNETQRLLKEFLPKMASVKNPVDMTAAAGGEEYEKTLKVVAEDGSIDSIIAIFAQAVSTEEANTVKNAILNATKFANSLGKPVIMIYAGTDTEGSFISDEGFSVPVFVYPNLAAKVLGKTADYALWRLKPKESIPSFEVDRDRAAAIIADSLDREWMRADKAFELLKCYGMSVPEYAFFTLSELYNDKFVLEKVQKLGKVAVKAVSEKIVHKTDLGAVKTNLEGEEAVEFAKNMVERLSQFDVEGVMFQKMAEGVEMYIGMSEDRTFGPIITCGAGGIFVEIFSDVSARVTPITRSEAVEMVKSLRSYSLLTGYRGRKPVNVDAFVDAILRINLLVEDFSEIVEIDCNPVVVNEKAAEVVDVRIRLRDTTAGRKR